MKTRMIQNTIGQSNSAIASYVYDCWKYPGDTNAKYARYFPNDGDYGNANWGRASDFNVEKADYLCLRDVSLYYDLPERWVRKLHMKKLTVGITCNTIAYWTGVTGAINPETVWEPRRVRATTPRCRRPIRAPIRGRTSSRLRASSSST